MIPRSNKLDAFKKWNAQTVIELKTSDEQLRILNQELKISKEDLKISNERLTVAKRRLAFYVQCSICCDFSPDVRTVCDHHFCKSCMDRLANMLGSGFRCPTCRRSLRGCSGEVLYNLEL